MQPQPLTRSEARMLLFSCPDTTNGIRDRAALTILYRGGTRIAATLRIYPSDIDWTNRLIAIQRDKGGRGRIITLDEEAFEILRLWHERRKSIGLNGHHPFFCVTSKRAFGNSIDPSHYRHKIGKLQRKAGIEKRCHLHGLRHTAASELLEEGFDLSTIANQLGHKQVSTTSRYLHQLRPDLMNEKLKNRVWRWPEMGCCDE